VLLVDEIDKADSELPNALLECFANQSFQVPYVAKPVARHPDQPPPLVVVTTNEERELPAPFLRRCLVLQLSLYTDDKDLRNFLVKRGKVHFDRPYQSVAEYDSILEEAANLLIKDRNSVSSDALYRPGQAEYLDLCRAVFETSQRNDCGSAGEILKEVSEFVLQKNASQ
jgi:MoxR-like ATPase